MTAMKNRRAVLFCPSQWRMNIEVCLSAKRVWVEYLAVTLLVCISGNYIFTLNGHPRKVLLIVASLLGILLLAYRTSFISSRLFFISISFASILIIQSIIFSFFPTITIAGFFIRIFIGYAVFHLVRDFPRIYVNVLCCIVVISLFFYVPEQICRAFGVDFQSFFHLMKSSPEASHGLHLGIHNFHYDSVPYRNASFFWEPGAFAGYLLLGLVFLGLAGEQFKARSYWARMSVLFVGVLTTFSTTGYIILPFVLLLHFRSDGRTKAVAIRCFVLFYLSALSIEYVTCMAVVGIGAVREKIETQYTDAFYNDGGRYPNRFNNLAADLEYIKRRPILGWGLNRKTRYMLHPGKEYGSGHGEGLTDFVVKFGLTGLGIFTLCVWTGFMQVSGRNVLMSSLATSLILLMLNGECFLNFPLFLGLMFLEQERSLTETLTAKQALSGSKDVPLSISFSSTGDLC